MKHNWRIVAATIMLAIVLTLPVAGPESTLAGENPGPVFSETGLTPADKAAYLNRVPWQQKIDYFKGLSEQDKKEIFNNVTGTDRLRIFLSLSNTEKRALFKVLKKEDREWLLKNLTGTDRQAILADMDQSVAGESPRQRPKGLQSRSKVEKILSGRFPSGICRELRQYGYEFFRKGTPSFTPLRNVPVGTDYIVGPGDEIRILMWGRLDNTYHLEIDSEGTLYIPKIGPLNVAGLTFGELKKLIKRKVGAITGVKATVSMGRLRTIDVFIVGEARHPATYAVSSLSTVISALYACGGPSKNGSLRGIKVFRNGQVAATLDLYDFFIKGRKSNDIRLQSGDTIFIPVLGPVAGIAGAVRRPAIYEMNGTKTVGELIQLAGGILPTSQLQNVVIERIEGHKRRVVKSFNMDTSNTGSDTNLEVPLKDFDVVKIYPVFEGVAQVVYLEGHVKYPREYGLKPGMRLLDVIPSYGCLLPEPYLPQAEIIRLVPPDLHPEIIPFNLGRLLAGDEDQNLLLHDQDRIVVYDTWEKEDIPKVTIEGAVRKPGPYRLLRGMTIRDLIFQAGNLKSNAFTAKATLSRIIPGSAGTTITEIDFSPAKAMAGLMPDNIVLKRDDSIRIRRIPQYHQALVQHAYVEGEVLFPGEYTFSDGDRLHALIEKAGGLTKQAYPFGASFYRESVKKVQKHRLKNYISKLEEDILTMSSQEAGKTLDKDQAAILKQTLDSRKQLVEKLKKARPTGRMVISLPEILADPSSPANLELRAGDRLVIRKRPDSINVMGEVYNPTAVFAEKSKTVRHYLDEVGGITPNGDRKQIYVVKANGSVISKGQDTFFGMTTWDSGKHRWVTGFESVRLDPGDTIVVPKKVDVYPWMKRTKDITQILYQIAVGAGVIVAAY